MATALNKLTNYIHTQEDFKGSSVTAQKEGALYNVYSYSTLIASFSGNTMMYFNDSSFSNTTSKLQHLIRANYTINGSKLNAPKTHKIWERE